MRNKHCDQTLSTSCRGKPQVWLAMLLVMVMVLAVPVGTFANAPGATGTPGTPSNPQTVAQFAADATAALANFNPTNTTTQAQVETAILTVRRNTSITVTWTTALSVTAATATAAGSINGVVTLSYPPVPALSQTLTINRPIPQLQVATATVHFDLNGGTWSNSGTSNVPITTPVNSFRYENPTHVPNPTRSNFRFNGWYSPQHRNFAVELGNNQQVGSSGLRLVASWVPQNAPTNRNNWVNVSFNPGSGQVNSSSSTLTQRMPVGARLDHMFGYTNNNLTNNNSRFAVTHSSQNFQAWYEGNSNNRFTVTTPVRNNMPTLNARFGGSNQSGDVQLIFNPQGGFWSNNNNWNNTNNWNNNWNNPWLGQPNSGANQTRWIYRGTRFDDHFGRSIANEVGVVVRPGFIFNGWFIGNTNNQFTNSSSTNTNNNSLTLNARWTPDPSWAGGMPGFPWAATPTQPTTPGTFPGVEPQPGAPATPLPPVVLPAPQPTTSALPDVPVNAWFNSYVNNVVNRGILTSLPDGNFHPNMNTTRIMFAQALYNVAGQPAVFAEPVFSDVSAGDWFAPAVVWANQHQIIQGMGNNLFAGDDTITREQLAVMMNRFAEVHGISFPQNVAPVAFTDAHHIAGWASSAVSSIQQAGIIQGRANGTFDPQATATRAEVATILTRFMTVFGG